MKLKYERFEGLGCFSIRGAVDVNQFKLVVVGLESLMKDLEETLLVNLSNATFADANLVTGLAELKKKLASLTKQKIYWISKERGIGDFPNTDLIVQRMSGFKFRQIGDRIKLDDQLYIAAEAIRVCEARIAELGGDEANARKVILENKVLREQKRILTECMKWQDFRLKKQSHVASTDPESEVKTAEAVKAVNEAMKAAFGTEVDV
jgi:hypothetical protein